jgi:serine/threonine protein phosphatase PrpC
MMFSVFQVSRMGGRKRNEDRMGYTYTQASAIFLVADGLGGHPEGDVAAQICLQVVTTLFHKQAAPKLANVPEFLSASMRACHEQLISYATMHALSQVPSSTLVIVVLQDDQCYTAHCGDSRRYLVRGGEVLSRTLDHSVAEWKDSMLLANGEAPVSKHMLYSCLGAPRQPLIEVDRPIELEVGDRLLLCSDGLWGNVNEEQIVDSLTAYPVTEAANELMFLALQHGGPYCDNVTLIAVAWEKADNPSLA